MELSSGKITNRTPTNRRTIKSKDTIGYNRKFECIIACNPKTECYNGHRIKKTRKEA